jgi:hypothetical protein
MRELDKALGEIAAIRLHLARGTLFRGYGPASLASTALLAIIAAGVQSLFILVPAQDLILYLALWSATAILATILIGVEAITRSRRIHSGLADDMILLAIEQFLPAACAGVLLTLVLLRNAPETLWMLPGLWQIVASLGMFASCRSLPRPLTAVAVWYLATGLICLALAQGEHSFSPFAMGIPFGLGQLLAAALLQWAGGCDEEG